MLPAADAALLCALVFATSVLSAIVGMAGGMVLLAAMVLWLEPLVAIPVHGWIQLAANGSRAWIQRVHVDRGILLRFAALLVPAGALGLVLAQALPAAGLRLAIGVFVLLATWRPRWLLAGARPERAAVGPRFVALGGVSGALNIVVGATGPLIAPFFLGLGLSRQALVGTKAACQAAGHLAKVALFGLGAGFALGPWLPFLAAAIACAFAGTWVGSLLLDRVSERAFELLYKVVLTAIALRLVLGELRGVVGV